MRVRKNVRQLSVAEKRAFVEALTLLKAHDGVRSSYMHALTRLADWFCAASAKCGRLSATQWTVSNSARPCWWRPRTWALPLPPQSGGNRPWVRWPMCWRCSLTTH